jgi:hypothetical protein
MWAITLRLALNFPIDLFNMLSVKNYQSSTSTFKSSSRSKEKTEREGGGERKRERRKYFKGVACSSFLSLKRFLNWTVLVIGIPGKNVMPLELMTMHWRLV